MVRTSVRYGTSRRQLATPHRATDERSHAPPTTQSSERMIPMTDIEGRDRSSAGHRDRLRDDEWPGQTECAGWSRAHVLAHLALNAEGLAGAVRGLRDGQPTPMYPSQTARDADIDDARGPAGCGHPRSAADVGGGARGGVGRPPRRGARSGLRADSWRTARCSPTGSPCCGCGRSRSTTPTSVRATPTPTGPVPRHSGSSNTASRVAPAAPFSRPRHRPRPHVRTRLAGRGRPGGLRTGLGSGMVAHRPGPRRPADQLDRHLPEMEGR